MAGKILYYENGRLPLGVILSEFPDEIAEIVPSVVKALEMELRPYEEARTMKAYYAMTAGLPGWFASKLGEEEIPKDRMRLLKESRWLMKTNRIDGIGGKPNYKGFVPLDMLKGIPIESLVDLQGVKRVGGKIKAFCPFKHKEPTYKFVINENNTFHCFNCGGEPGTAIDFVMKYHNKDLRGAIQFLKERLQ